MEDAEDQPLNSLVVKTKVEVTVGDLFRGAGMYRAPDEPGWLEEWAEIGRAMAHAYSSGSGKRTPFSP